MVQSTECVVVGAGVIGLAVARRVARGGSEVIVLEAEDGFGTATSSRNSEVLHAGIYYTPGSLKARLCVSGLGDLYRYCQSRGVAHARTGKLIVAATTGQAEVLLALAENGRANGVEGLEWLDRARAVELEPALACAGALASPSTGIIDSHGLMLSYLGEAEDAGAAVAYRSRLTGAEVKPGGGFRLRVRGPDGAEAALECGALVNAAGLGAQDVAGSIEGLPADSVPARHLCKGSYFTVTGRAPFRRLIYPAPDSASLGIHLTLDLAGQARFGPDQEWVGKIDYAVEPARAEAFYGAIRRYWPDLPDGALEPAYAGIRPKVQAPGEPPADFVIQGPGEHGVAGLVCLYGLESPGLTASLAIADMVAALLLEAR